MNEIAEPAPHTPLARVQPTTSLPKVRHRAQLAIYRPRSIPSAVQLIASFLRRILILESRVNVSDQVIIVIVADDDLLDFAEFTHFAPEIFVEGVEVVLELGGVHARFVVVGRVLVEVGEEDGLGVGGFDVFAGAAVAVSLIEGDDVSGLW